MELSEEQQTKYLEHPYHCPACGHDEIESSPIVGEDTCAVAKVHCLNCGVHWTDVFTLTGIDDVKTKEEP